MSNPMIECPHCGRAVDYSTAKPANMTRGAEGLERFHKPRAAVADDDVARYHRQQAAREHARDQALREGKPELFTERYEAACATLGVDAHERIPPPPRFQRPAPARRTLGGNLEARAGERARDRALREGRPDLYREYVEEALARAS